MAKARAAVVGAVAIAIALTTSSCSQGLIFRETGALVIVEPEPYSTQGQPVIIRWSGSATRGEQAYAVFLERAPVMVGESAIVAQRADPTRVYITTEEELVLPRLSNGSSGETDAYDVTVVLLDEAGLRADENFAFVEFLVEP